MKNDIDNSRNNFLNKSENIFILLDKFLLSKTVLGLLIFGFSLYLFLIGNSITGPFIFGDELVYYSFSRDIFLKNNLDIYPQYGPLYSYVISLFFGKKVIFNFQIIKLLNILFYSSTILPAYLIAKKLFQNSSCQFTFIVISILSPFSGYIHLILSEALYYPLFFWTCLWLIKFIEQPNFKNNFLFCLFLCSLYYTKPPAGLITLIAGLLTITFHVFFVQKKAKKYLISSVIFVSFLSFLLIHHYHQIGTSIIGYSSTEGFKKQILNTNTTSLFLNIFKSYFYQYSYVVYASCGSFLTLMLIWPIFFKQLSNIEKTFSLFIILGLLGLFFLCACGMSIGPTLDYRMPQGRYYSFYIPFIITIIINKLMIVKFPKESLIKLAILSIVMIPLFIICCPPFVVSNPVAYTSMAEESLILYFINHGLLIWKKLVVIPTFSQTLYLGLIICVIQSLIFFLQTRFKPYLIHVICITIMLLSFYNTILENKAIKIMGESQNALNEIYIYLIEQKVKSQQLFIDEDLKDGNTQFMSPFWYSKKANYISIENFINSKNKKEVYFWTKQKLNLKSKYINNEYKIYAK